MFAVAVLLISGCVCAPGRYQVVPVPWIIGYERAGSIRVDTLTGETWAQDWTQLQKPDGKTYAAVYWHKMPTTKPTALPPDAR